jgi:RHS repeat-associated protein
LYNEVDAETGYNEFALRSYDPQIGRWVQSDPYDVEPGMYNGMGNDPVNRVDPTGGWDWVSYFDPSSKSTKVKWVDEVTDILKVNEWGTKNGYTNISYIGISGLWTSNVNG